MWAESEYFIFVFVYAAYNEEAYLRHEAIVIIVIEWAAIAFERKIRRWKFSMVETLRAKLFDNCDFLSFYHSQLTHRNGNVQKFKVNRVLPRTKHHSTIAASDQCRALIHRTSWKFTAGHNTRTQGWRIYIRIRAIKYLVKMQRPHYLNILGHLDIHIRVT